MRKQVIVQWENLGQWTDAHQYWNCDEFNVAWRRYAIYRETSRYNCSNSQLKPSLALLDSLRLLAAGLMRQIVIYLE